MRTKNAGAIIRQIVQTIIFVLVLLILISTIYRIVAQKFFGQNTPTVCGYASAVVLTGSMSGAIEPDDLIITHRQSEYAEGDIITYQIGGNTPVTHRIISINENGYLTKGDANNTDDGIYLSKDNIIGKVIVTIPKIGVVIRFAHTPMGMICLLAILALIFELSYIIQFFRHLGEKQEN